MFFLVILSGVLGSFFLLWFFGLREIGVRDNLGVRSPALCDTVHFHEFLESGNVDDDVIVLLMRFWVCSDSICVLELNNLIGHVIFFKEYGDLDSVLYAFTSNSSGENVFILRYGRRYRLDLLFFGHLFVVDSNRLVISRSVEGINLFMKLLPGNLSSIRLDIEIHRKEKKVMWYRGLRKRVDQVKLIVIDICKRYESYGRVY